MIGFSFSVSCPLFCCFFLLWETSKVGACQRRSFLSFTAIKSTKRTGFVEAILLTDFIDSSSDVPFDKFVFEHLSFNLLNQQTIYIRLNWTKHRIPSINCKSHLRAWRGEPVWDQRVTALSAAWAKVAAETAECRRL